MSTFLHVRVSQKLETGQHLTHVALLLLVSQKCKIYYTLESNLHLFTSINSLFCQPPKNTQCKKP